MILWQDNTRIKWNDIKGFYLNEYNGTLESACKNNAILNENDLVDLFEAYFMNSIGKINDHSVIAKYDNDAQVGYLVWESDGIALLDDIVLKNSHYAIRFRRKESDTTAQVTVITTQLHNAYNGVLYLGDIIFGEDASKTYCWTNENNKPSYELKSSFLPILSNSKTNLLDPTLYHAQEDKLYYLFNTKYFKINSNYINVITSSTDEIQDIDNGNYTYEYAVKYTPKIEGRNKYAFNKSNITVFPIYHNIEDEDVDLTIHNNTLIINNKSYPLPINASVLVCRRKCAQSTPTQFLTAKKNIEELDRPESMRDWEAGVELYTNHKNILRDYAQVSIHLDNVDHEVDKIPTPTSPGVLCKVELDFSNSYQYTQINSENNISTTLSSLNYFNIDWNHFKYENLFRPVSKTLEYNVELSKDHFQVGDPNNVVHGRFAEVTGLHSRRYRVRYDNPTGGAPITHYLYGETGKFVLETKNLYECSLFKYDPKYIEKNQELVSVISDKTFSYASYSMYLDVQTPGFISASGFGWIKDYTSVWRKTFGSTQIEYNISSISEDCQAYAKVGSYINSDYRNDKYWVFIVAN